ncbi:hypothetical protein BJ165DRAFT_1492901 [Panaeolus papilionaceus]|nr:hypothetical protein BJ165DRAFT_1492901 [Panaeolus papilionaceus]
MSILMSSSQPTVLPLISIHIVSQINLIMIPHPHHAYDRRPQRPDQRTLSLHLLSERVREIVRSECGDGPEGLSRVSVLVSLSIGARTKKYIKLSTMNVRTTTTPFVKHEWIKDGGEVMFEMGREAEVWGEVRWEHGWEVEAGEEGVRDELREL